MVRNGHFSAVKYKMQETFAVLDTIICFQFFHFVCDELPLAFILFYHFKDKDFPLNIPPRVVQVIP